MKFRGKIVDIGCIHHFTRVIGTLSKLIKSCVLRITPGNWYFILAEKLANGGIQIWCELPQGHFFDEYAMEGVSKEANEIYLEVAPDNIPTLSSHSRTVVHDVPVSVIPRRLWEDYEEPELPHFDVSIAMPQMKLLKNMIDKMKNLSNHMVLSANQNGEMKLSVETDMAAVSTHFRDLINPSTLDQVPSSHDSSPERVKDPTEFSKARIDIRKFAQFLSGQLVNPTKVICNIVHNKVVHFLLLNEDVSLQYFMPVVAS
ncbi:HUS1 [Mytilus edulis]|uniref:Checkpoint protein n=1 Tax=Mytilus edulis TaxID=6550 RepID=A0A8S3URB2_MYTED|nr:HUS1 [Mytilus edulis]